MNIKGCWDADQAAAFASEALIPLRIALNDAAGFPLVLSLWFLLEDGAFWCATQVDAHVVKRLAQDHRCAFEIAGDAPPYRGIRGKARASLHADRGEEILKRLLARYGIAEGSRLARSLLTRADTEVAICIVPERMTSWDFSVRMADAQTKG